MLPLTTFNLIATTTTCLLHQQFDERLESLDQIAPGAPGTSDVTDICLESGRSLSGPDVVFCV